MKIGTGTSLWQYPFNWEGVELLSKIKGFGFDVVELLIEDTSKKNLDIIKENVQKNNLECAICSSFVEGNLISDDREVVDRGVKYIKGQIDICEYFGSGILAGPTYGSLINFDFLKPEIKNKARKQAVQLLKEVGSYALDKKIKVAIEPLNRNESNFLNTAREGIDLVEEIGLPNVGLNLDTYHMNIEEKNIEKAILEAGQHLFHLHAPENDRGTPGTGHINWEGVAESIKKIDFSGFVMMESGNAEVEEMAKLGAFWRLYDYPADKIAQEGLKFLRGLFS